MGFERPKSAFEMVCSTRCPDVLILQEGIEPREDTETSSNDLAMIREFTISRRCTYLDLQFFILILFNLV